jgi:hypothetical protein
MKTFHSILKRVLLAILTGGAGLVLAACYGVAYVSRRITVRAVNASQNPIPGIQVGGEDVAEEAITGEDGTAAVSLWVPGIGAPASVVLSDIDGAANGSYVQEPADATDVAEGGTLTVTLDPAD